MMHEYLREVEVLEKDMRGKVVACVSPSWIVFGYSLRVRE